MLQAGESPKRIRFASFEVDLAAAELRKHGVRIRLQEQPFQVLTALLENPGEVITREDLIRRLWADGTVVDYDRGLNAAVTRLRQALSDSAETPRFVETVARRGYRFVAPVEAIGEAARTPAPAARTRVLKPAWILAAVAAAVLAVAAVWWAGGRRGAAPPAASELRTEPLTTLHGFEQNPSFSPDGSHVAFEWDQGAGVPHVFVQVVGAGEPVRLTSAAALESGPEWSPDGRSIAFIRRLEAGRAGVFVVPALGGVERRLIEFAIDHWVLNNRLRRVSWMPGGRYLVVSGPDIEGRERLFRLSVEDGGQTWLTSAPQSEAASFGDREPAVSPDGRWVAFTRGRFSIDEGLHVLPLTSEMLPAGPPRRLAAGRASSPAWTPDSREIVFGDNRRLVIIPLAGSVGPRPLSSLGSGSAPALSRAGELAFSQGIHDTNVWRQDLRDGVNPPPVRLIASSRDDQDARYSPDGTRIALQSNRSGFSEIHVCSADGLRCAQLTGINRPEITGTPRWSPDGRWIAFDSAFEGLFNVYVVSANGGAPRRLTPRTGGAIPSWSQDGKWIYFGSQTSGRWEVWKIPSAGGEPLQVTREGGQTAFESPDGRHLFYTRSDEDRRLFKSAPDGSAETMVLDGVARRGFAVARDRVYYLREEPGGHYTLRRFLLTSRSDARLATITKPTYLGLSLSPDGESLLYSQVDQMGADLMVVRKFAAPQDR